MIAEFIGLFYWAQKAIFWSLLPFLPRVAAVLRIASEVKPKAA